MSWSVSTVRTGAGWQVSVAGLETLLCWMACFRACIRHIRLAPDCGACWSLVAWTLLCCQSCLTGDQCPGCQATEQDLTDQTADDADLNQMFDLDGAVQV